MDHKKSIQFYSTIEKIKHKIHISFGPNCLNWPPWCMYVERDTSLSLSLPWYAEMQQWFKSCGMSINALPPFHNTLDCPHLNMTKVEKNRVIRTDIINLERAIDRAIAICRARRARPHGPQPQHPWHQQIKALSPPIAGASLTTETFPFWIDLC